MCVSSVVFLLVFLSVYFLNYFFFLNTVSIHPSSPRGEPSLDVSAGGLSLAMG